MKICSGLVVTGVASSPIIPTDSRANPVNLFGSIKDGGTSTYALSYTTADVFAAGYNPSTDPFMTAVPGAPTTGSHPFNVTGLGATGLWLNVTAGSTTVTIQVFQSDNNIGG